ncbi:complement factor H-related protein 1-like isoform X2 [Clupea harengus]|uniref:Complement factor H-related protein 1-like isoform X2 n=1 Tax=Clupea harengus TaxID=7950 RepID=A0A8M1KCE3_CLUHA|nr:complement factor H-related protein 1-like isoform X2 [Clupea harengus]
MAQNLKQMANYLVITFCILLCRTAEGRRCQRPFVENGFFHPDQQTYPDKETVNYRCDSGYKPITEGWWSTITCEQGTWSPDPKCIDKDDCIPPEIRHGRVTEPKKSSYWNRNTVKFACNTGYLSKDSQLTCQNGDWTPLPICARNQFSCSAPPRVFDAVIEQEFRDIFDENESVVYDCIDSYTMIGRSRSTCSKGTWTEPPSCVPGQSVMPSPTENSRDKGEDVDRPGRGVGGQECPDPPVIENGDFTKEGENKAIYQCSSFYKLNLNNPTITCSNGQWDRLPRCEPNFCKVEGKIPHLRAIDSPVFLKDIEEKYFPCDDSWYRYRALGTCRVKTGKMEFSGCGYNNHWTFP